MKVSKLNQPSKIVLLNTNKFLIDWEKDGASKIEVKFRNLIFPYWKNCIVLYQCRIPGSLLRLDFLNVNKKILVETDGKQHENFNSFFHNNSRANYLASIKRDLSKEKWCEQNGIRVVHLTKEDLEHFSIDKIENPS